MTLSKLETEPVGRAILVVLASWLAAGLVTPLAAAPATNGAVLPRYGFSQYLYRLGRLADCYFTLEEEAPPGIYATPTYLVDIPSFDPAETAVKGPEDVLALLQRKLPDHRAWQDSGNPAVIHLAARSLLKAGDYPLESVVSFNYSGTLDGLVSRLQGITGGAIHSTRLIAISQMSGPDARTTVDIPNLHGSVRQVLTDSIPLSSYHRILWEAMWEETNGRFSLRLEQSGPRGPAAYYRGEPGHGPTHRFSEGEAAYLLNPDDPVQHTLALQFLAQRMKEPNHAQARWAMLYLGRFHVAGAVPLLLRDIDYRFTSSAIATEMYPAYFALLREGRCAISPTLAAMRTEADERRLLLMAGTVLGVDGIARGRDEIQQQWRAASSEQRPRIHRAVVSALDASGPLSGRAVKTGL